MARFVQAVRHRSPQGIVPIEHSPRRLQHRVQQAVTGRPVPESVKSGAESNPNLLTPVDDV